MIETKSIDLERPLNLRGEIVNFTEHDNLHWAGIVDLAPWVVLLYDARTKNEFYILKGSLISRAGVSYTSGTFISLSGEWPLSSGAEGVKLYAYREGSVFSNILTIITPDELKWHDGGAMGMRVAAMHESSNDLLLVSWMRGTKMPFHLHPRGEEFYVLKGELCDESGRYKAGTWQRLHPGTGHAPYAETDTLILLRNGHLPPLNLKQNNPSGVT